MSTIMRISGRNLPFVRRRGLVTGGMAAILATGLAPAVARAEAKKLVFAHVHPVSESAAVAFDWMAGEVKKQSNGELDMQFFGATLFDKEFEIMNAVTSGTIAMGSPAGAAATVFPEMGVFPVPYLVKDYAHAYRMFNGALGDRLDRDFQQKYGVKTLCYFDYGFRHFFTTRTAIVEPKDLHGARIRVQQARAFGDTINGLGGNAVPMAWRAVIPAARQGEIDGGDLPIVNMRALEIGEVAKYASLTSHNYSPTNVLMNLAVWHGLTPAQQRMMLDVAREAQRKIRAATEAVDTFETAREILEPKGMTVVKADIEAFRKIAQDKIWPAYKKQYGVMWDEIAGFEA
jgi:TRAP-type transport system periplasmic protein